MRLYFVVTLTYNSLWTKVSADPTKCLAKKTTTARDGQQKTSYYMISHHCSIPMLLCAVHAHTGKTRLSYPSAQGLYNTHTHEMNA